MAETATPVTGAVETTVVPGARADDQPHNSSQSGRMMTQGGWSPDAVFDELATASLIVDASCTLIAANAAATAIFRMTREELIGTRFIDRWSPGDQDRLHRAAAGLIQTASGRLVLDWVRLNAFEDDQRVVTVAITRFESTGEALVLCEVVDQTNPLAPLC